MLIGVDVSRTAETKTGLHSYAASLLAALSRIDRDNDYHLYPFVSQCLPTNFKRAYRPRARNFKLLGRWANQRAVAQRLDDPKTNQDNFFGDAPDVYFSPFHFVPTHRFHRLVCVFHDISWHLHPEFSTPENLELCQRSFDQARNGADRILTVSDHAREEMIRHLGVPPERVVSTPLAAAPIYRPVPRAQIPRRFRRRFGNPDQWLIFVGSVEPRKNIATVIRALDVLWQRGRCHPHLMIVGGTGWKNAEVYDLVRDRGLDDRVFFAGQASDRELLQLNNAATLAVCPSIYEGFGLPLMEALACGLPAVASRVASYPQVGGDAAAFVEDPLDVDGFVREIEECLLHPEVRASMRQRGLAHAARFSWDKCARQTLDVLESVHRDPAYVRHCVHVGADERGAVAGWHPLERAGDIEYRWTARHATALLTPGSGDLIVSAAGGAPGQILSIRIGKECIGQCELSENWKEFRFETNGVTQTQCEVELELEVNYPVPDTRKPGDTRTLGAKVSRFGFEA